MLVNENHLVIFKQFSYYIIYDSQVSEIQRMIQSTSCLERLDISFMIFTWESFLIEQNNLSSCREFFAPSHSIFAKLLWRKCQVHGDWRVGKKNFLHQQGKNQKKTIKDFSSKPFHSCSILASLFFDPFRPLDDSITQQHILGRNSKE